VLKREGGELFFDEEGEESRHLDMFLWGREGTSHSFL